MATQAIPGFKGALYVSSDDGMTETKIAEVRDVTLSISTEELEATSFDSNGWMEFVPGMKEWELEMEGIYVAADAGQGKLYDALVNGTVLLVRFFPKDETSENGYEGSGFITSWEINNTVDDIVPLSASFRGTGALTQITKQGGLSDGK